MNIYSVLTWNACITLERDFWFASIVTRPAQQTKALELDRPELGGTVPSTTHDIPAKWAIPNFSCKKDTTGRLIPPIYSITLFGESITLLQYCILNSNLVMNEWRICGTKYTSYLNTFYSTEKIIMPLWILSVYGDVLWTRHREIPAKWQTTSILKTDDDTVYTF